MDSQTNELMFMEKILIEILKENRCWHDMHETCKALCQIRSVYKRDKREFEIATSTNDTMPDIKQSLEERCS